MVRDAALRAALKGPSGRAPPQRQKPRISSSLELGREQDQTPQQGTWCSAVIRGCGGRSRAASWPVTRGTVPQ